MITSTANAGVKQVAALVKRAKDRNEAGLFVVEGPKMFGELPKERAVRVYVTERFRREPGNRAMLKGVERVEEVSEDVMRAMSGTGTPQGVLALARQYGYGLEDVLGGGEKGASLLLILEAIQDPGNLGTILRAGEGAGMTGILTDSRTADIYQPKVVRSTMGSVFRVPFLRVEDLRGTIKEIKSRGVTLFAARMRGGTSYDKADYTGSTGFLIGNESAGLSDETAELADGFVRIPMLGRVESLNAAVASAILLFEAARQRRNRGSSPDCRGHWAAGRK